MLITAELFVNLASKIMVMFAYIIDKKRVK